MAAVHAAISKRDPLAPLPTELKTLRALLLRNDARSFGGQAQALRSASLLQHGMLLWWLPVSSAPRPPRYIYTIAAVWVASFRERRAI